MKKTNITNGTIIRFSDIYQEALKILPQDQIDHHFSDLYLKKNSKSRKIVEQYEHKHLVSEFKDQIDHEIWYEIPFAYTPFYNSLV